MRGLASLDFAAGKLPLAGRDLADRTLRDQYASVRINQATGGDLDALAWRRSVLRHQVRSEEHTSELQSLMRISYAVFCLKKKKVKSPEAHSTATAYKLAQ